jgi:hypothetical protein
MGFFRRYRVSPLTEVSALYTKPICNANDLVIGPSEMMTVSYDKTLSLFV